MIMASADGIVFPLNGQMGARMASVALGLCQSVRRYASYGYHHPCKR